MIPRIGCRTFVLLAAFAIASLPLDPLRHFFLSPPASPLLSTLPPALSSLPPLRHRYLISSAIDYGRLSNAKLSLTELLGLARALNRTAVVPKLSACGEDGADSSFDVLFDATALSHEGVLSLASFDLARECGDDGAAAFVSVGGGEGELYGPPTGATFEFGGLLLPAFRADDISPNTLEVAAQSSAVNFSTDATIGSAAGIGAKAKSFAGPFFSGPGTTSEALRDPLFALYFAPAFAAVALPSYMVEPLLPDKLALHGEACLVLGRTFVSLNWARLPHIFAEVGRELQPHAAVRAEAEEFLARHGLLRLTFVAVHLRMGDFLTDIRHASFGLSCNREPALLTNRLRKLLDSDPALASAGVGGVRILLATDDYDSACAEALLHAFPGTITLRYASRFAVSSCRAALVDQEILARAAIFVGDTRSSFSQAVHQIRTLRFARHVSTTIWM